MAFLGGRERDRIDSIDQLTTPHRIPAIQTLVTSARPHRDRPADIAGGGVGLHFGALLAHGIGDDGQAQVHAAGGGDVGGLVFLGLLGAVVGVAGVAVGEGFGVAVASVGASVTVAMAGAGFGGEFEG